MKKITLRILTLLCAALMLFGTLALSACSGNGNGGTATTTEQQNGEVTPGVTTTEAPGTTTEGNVTTGGDEPVTEPLISKWLVGDLEEKIAALNNYYGRPMSIALGGDSQNHAYGSMEAIEAAIALGADAIGVYVRKTKDNVLVALTSSDLYDSTNFSEMKGKDGLPTQSYTSSWTYEQIQMLSLKNADGTVSDKKVPKFDDVIKACVGKCFIYIGSSEKTFDDIGDDIYKAVKDNSAYASFLITPGSGEIAEWAEDHPEDTKLAEFVTGTLSKFYHQMDYFDVRTAVDPTKSDKDSGWTRVSDDKDGWKAAYATGRSLLITKNIKEYCEWVSAEFKSAKEYTPDQFDHVQYSIKKDDLTARYMFISDIHYAPVEQSGYINRDTYRGYSNTERMVKMCADIKAEYAERGLDAIFILGDLTTDDPGHRDKSYLKELYDLYLDPLSEDIGVPIIATAGNHDGHNNTFWKVITGNDRQYVWENTKTGDVVILADTYNPELGDNNAGSGISWTGGKTATVDWIEQQLETYKDRKNVFVASHYFGRESTNLLLTRIVRNYPNVTALFDGHSHSYTEDCSELGDTGKKIINTGNYSYGDTAYVYENGIKYYDFNYHDSDDVWGYNIVEITSTKAISYRIDVDAFYCAANYTTPNVSGGEFIEIRDYRPYKKYEEIVFYE